MKRLCVYCGSNSGAGDVYADAARALGELMVGSDIGLVYGGANLGLMGTIADTVLAGGGEVRGVIPRALEGKELAHEGLTQLHVVDSMHERKSLMAVLADGFVALPGGFGTLEEIIEVLTWGQLQFHGKPCGLLNVDGYFDHLLAFFDHARARGFLRPQHRDMLIVADTPAALLDRFEHYAAPDVQKWHSEQQS
jgi:uncharacterized protein (TIGR00730 family)